jgi:uncharacterized YigZ family protein
MAEFTELVDKYVTVKQEAHVEFEEKRSLFIGHAIHVKDEEEAAAFVKSIKKQYADATHNVWAYHLKGGIIARYSDDGEPQGTAGMPVLEAIRKSGVDDTCVVVTRYFGGILLGAGGLVRAYSHSAVLAINEAEIVVYEPYNEYSLSCGYSEYQKYSNVLSFEKAIIDSTDFTSEVLVRFAVKKNQAEQVLKRISEVGYGRDIPKLCGERFDCR